MLSYLHCRGMSRNACLVTRPFTCKWVCVFQREEGGGRVVALAGWAISFLSHLMPLPLSDATAALQVADSAKAVAEQCDITVAMLADPQAAEAVATGPDGIAAGMSSGDLCQTLFADAVICILPNLRHLTLMLWCACT